MIFAKSLDPDEAQQNMGSHLESKLFDTQIVYQQKINCFAQYAMSLFVLINS